MKLPDGWVAIVHADAKATKIDMETRELVMCRNCKYFTVKDWWAKFGKVPVLGACDVPTCEKWGGGCYTKPDGYCHLGERRDDDVQGNQNR